MKKWIIRGLILVALLPIYVIVLVFICWFVFGGLSSYNRVHYGIFKTASNDRLQLLAHQAATLADTLTGTNVLDFSRDRNMPSEFKDLDPTYITIWKDTARFELHGGFDHYGFEVRRSDSDSNLWTVVRYTEIGDDIPVVTYRRDETAINSVEPTRAPDGVRGSP